MDITPLGDECRAAIELRVFSGANVMWAAIVLIASRKCRDPSKSDDDCMFVWATSPGFFSHLGKEIAVD